MNDLIGSLFEELVFLLVFQDIRKSIYWRNKDAISLIFPWLSLELVEFPDFSLIFLGKTHFPDFAYMQLNLKDNFPW